MAADSRSIVITLKLEESSRKETDTNNQTSESAISESSDNDSSSKIVATMAVQRCIQVAVSETTSWIDYYWNQELSLTDDYIGQRKKSIATTQINRVASSAVTIASTTALGAKAGPVGAIVGFVVGVVAEVATTIRSNVQGQQQQDIQIAQMNASLSFTRSRVGWSTTAASIGEDL